MPPIELGFNVLRYAEVSTAASLQTNPMPNDLVVSLLEIWQALYRALFSDARAQFPEPQNRACQAIRSTREASEGYRGTSIEAKGC
jgi:hypothetical protein